MFPIARLSAVKKLAELQNNLGTIAIENNALNHREVNYRVFRLELSPELNTEEVIDTYYSELNFFSRTVVTSVSRYRRTELTIAVPVVSGLIEPFGCFKHDNGISVEMDINIRETLAKAAQNILNVKELIGMIVYYHWRNEYNARLFSGKIEGSFFSTITASRNRLTWPKWSPKNELQQ